MVLVSAIARVGQSVRRGLKMLYGLSVLLWHISEVAHAHPAAAAAPEFPAAECVATIDKSQQELYALSYVNPADDTALTEGDIPLPDAKTHQFFAFRGALAVYGQGYTFRTFGDAAAKPVELPLWITHADVQRAAAASAKLMGSMLPQAWSDLPDEAVMETFAPLQDQWLRMMPDNKRVPILERQTLIPVHWRLSDVPVGVYTLAGYIFSPPYNGWAIRQGVVKIRDAQHDPPAGQIAGITDTVFSYQGRKVSACLDVPEGTRLDGYYLQEDQPDSDWQSWFQDRPATTGQLGLCFHSKRTDLSGSVRLRLVLRAPDGTSTVLHASDTLTWLQGKGRCEETNTQCCEFDETPVKPSLAGVTAGVLSVDGTLKPAGSGGAGSAAPSAQHDGCSVLRLRAESSHAGLYLVLLSGFAWRIRRRVGS